MNYQESLTRLEEEKNKLEDKVKNSSGGGNTAELDKRKLKFIEEVIKGYSHSPDEEVSNDKVEQAFSKVHGFDKQKEEVKSLLLVQKYFKAKALKTRAKGKVLCFVGPPGVGKTHFAEQLAEALGRKFHRVNLGGSASAIIITGGEEMWVGSKQGEIVNSIAKTQSCNPVVLLDEVEKSGKDEHHGTITNALLHVLDPEQNQHFKDHFLDVEIDISQITFVLTANEIEKISDPLKNRLEIISLKEYDEKQKLQIGKILIDKIFQKDYENSNKDLFEMNEEALRTLISKTKEPGVRQLEKKLQKIISWCVSQWVQSLEKVEEEQKIIIDEDKVNELFEDAEKEEEKDEETKLREKNEELEQEIEDLKKSRQIYSLTKPLEISQEKKYCPKHQRETLQTTNKACFLCELEQQTEQFIATISKENREKVEQIWQEQKLEWLKQATDIQSGSPEEKEIGQHIKSSIKKIDKKLQQVKNSSSASLQSNWMKNWPWIIGGGIILLLFGYYLGWLFTKKFKKKKQSRLSTTNSRPPS